MFHWPFVYRRVINGHIMFRMATFRLVFGLVEISRPGSWRVDVTAGKDFMGLLRLLNLPTLTGWWFGTVFVFPYIGNKNRNLLIFFRGVETTNQLRSGIDVRFFAILLFQAIRNHSAFSTVFWVWAVLPMPSEFHGFTDLLTTWRCCGRSRNGHIAIPWPLSCRRVETKIWWNVWFLHAMA